MYMVKYCKRNFRIIVGVFMRTNNVYLYNIDIDGGHAGILYKIIKGPFLTYSSGLVCI